MEDFQSSPLSTITNSDFKNYNATSLQLSWTIGLEIGTFFQINRALIEMNLRRGYKFHPESDTWKIDDMVSYK